MTGPLLLPVLPSKHLRAWPKHDKGSPLGYQLARLQDQVMGERRGRLRGSAGRQLGPGGGELGADGVVRQPPSSSCGHHPARRRSLRRPPWPGCSAAPLRFTAESDSKRIGWAKGDAQPVRRLLLLSLNCL